MEHVKNNARPNPASTTRSEDDASRQTPERIADLFCTQGIFYALENCATRQVLSLPEGYQGRGAAVAQAPLGGPLPHAAQWQLVRADCGYHIVNRHNALCLNVSYGSRQDGAALQVWDENEGHSEQWRMWGGKAGYFKIVNDHSMQAITVLSDASSPVQMPDTNQDTQMWRLLCVDSATVHPWAWQLAAAFPPPERTLSIYGVFPEIFSAQGDLPSVTEQLPRIAALGVGAVYLMPLHPRGAACGPHPSYHSPYAVKDFFSIAPNIGTLDDLASLHQAANTLGMKVFVDQVLNHSAWDNPLITAHPEFYTHTDSEVTNPRSISHVSFGEPQHSVHFHDAAQFDYRSQTSRLQSYMLDMLSFWLPYCDGFRLDMASNPSDDRRLISRDMWLRVGARLHALRPDFLLWGECEDPTLSLAPFTMDYGWSLEATVKQVVGGRDCATAIAKQWLERASKHPPGMLHTNIMQNWDSLGDLKTYGGHDQVKAVATLNFTIDGVPMIFNGAEVGSMNAEINTHEKISWGSLHGNYWTDFFGSLLALRNHSQALSRGTLMWLDNSASKHVVSYERTFAAERAVVIINFSGQPQHGQISGVANGRSWLDVSPKGVPGGVPHREPPSFNLGPWDCAIFFEADAP